MCADAHAILSGHISVFSYIYENRHTKTINIRTKRRLISMSKYFWIALQATTHRCRVWKTTTKRKKSLVEMNDCCERSGHTHCMHALPLWSRHLGFLFGIVKTLPVSFTLASHFTVISLLRTTSLQKEMYITHTHRHKNRRTATGNRNVSIKMIDFRSLIVDGQ